MPSKFKIFIAWLIPILFLGLLAYFIPNTYAYFDPLSACHISIHGDIVKGDESTIKRALKNLKKSDPNTYKDVCTYVDRIYERVCQGSDWHLGELRGIEEPGCYLRGSKAIYVFPDTQTDEEIVTARMEIIKKYSQMSREFWEGLKR